MFHALFSIYKLHKAWFVGYIAQFAMCFIENTVHVQFPLPLNFWFIFIDSIVFESYDVFPSGGACVKNDGPCYGVDDNNDCFTGSGDCSCDIKDQVSCYVNEGTIDQ